MVNFPSPAKQHPRRKNLPPPPTAAEAPANLEAPEIAPAAIDGRSARATGRTAQLATRVRPDWLHELKIYAATHRLKLVEVLELGFDALKQQRRNG